MARARNRAGDSGWPAALGGALLLVALGFVLGMVAGFAMEAPGLLMDHLAGRSTEVPLAPAGPAAASASAAAESATGPGAASTPGAQGRAVEAAPFSPGASSLAAAAPAKRAASSAASRRAAARRAPAPAPAQRTAARAPVQRTAAVQSSRAPAPPAGRFSVQVSAFASANSARSMASALRADGVPAQVVDTQSGNARYKVRVGPLATKAEAQRMAQRLTDERGLDTWVVAGERR